MTYRYVLHENVQDYLNCGWDIAFVRNGFACLLVWLCACPCVEPIKGGRQ